MKACFLVGIVGCLLLSPGWGAETGFTQSLSPDELRAAGLDRLLPAELQRLDELVAKFNHGKTTAARQAAEDARVAQQKADAALAAQREAEAAAKAAQAEAQRAKAEAAAEKAAAAANKASDKGFFAKAKLRLVPGTQIEYAEIRSTIEGRFEGWSSRTVFRLANGQHWQVVNSDERYFVPPQQDVEVEIRPAALGGYWMYFPALEKRVRVKLLGEK